MEQLDSCLQPLSNRHRKALAWFADATGTEQSWPSALDGPEGKTLLSTKAKGIYKPNWSTYALSVRENLDGPYPDRAPVLRSDGTWIYSYFQENEDPSARDSEYTNRGLMECWRDRVPIGVMRQTRAKPHPRYLVLGIALVAGWDGGYFYLEGFSKSGLARPRGPSGEIELLTQKQEKLELESGGFNSHSAMDARERTLAQIVRRRGQPHFRIALLEAYDNCCAISGYDATESLEAARISPNMGPETNRIVNGLLLRADLHTLFDLGLIAVRADVMEVLIAPSLAETSYSDLAGRELRLPKEQSDRPSEIALQMHRQWSGL